MSPCPVFAIPRRARRRFCQHTRNHRIPRLPAPTAASPLETRAVREEGKGEALAVGGGCGLFVVVQKPGTPHTYPSYFHFSYSSLPSTFSHLTFRFARRMLCLASALPLLLDHTLYPLKRIPRGAPLFFSSRAS